jgi:hypothetical protein
MSVIGYVFENKKFYVNAARATKMAIRVQDRKVRFQSLSDDREELIFPFIELTPGEFKYIENWLKSRGFFDGPLVCHLCGEEVERVDTHLCKEHEHGMST